MEKMEAQRALTSLTNTIEYIQRRRNTVQQLEQDNLKTYPYTNLEKAKEGN